MLKAEKQKKKEFKYMAKKLQEEEAARIAEEERIKKEKKEQQAAEAAALQKKNREKEKKLLRKERIRLRTLSTNVVSQHLLNLNKDDVESLCASLDMLALQTLCDNMDTKEESEQAKLLGEALAFDTFLEKRKPEESISSPLSTRDELEGVSSNSTPAGVSSMVNGVANGVANCVVNGVANGVADGVVNGMNADSDSDEWSTVQVTSLVQAMKTFPKEANQRWERIAAAVLGKTVNQCKK
uniref:DnaJ homolog subfamily C member 2-like n=1 Tax=Tanacetum cinerariifolium TaxID=118510 RepID=A0A6L2KEN9_TANCI|nr:DnaJ homolog subfamily C member 2-like [Tanacetum cinerariifolium]